MYSVDTHKQKFCKRGIVWRIGQGKSIIEVSGVGLDYNCTNNNALI